jgi:hypothetical protein
MNKPKRTVARNKASKTGQTTHIEGDEVTVGCGTKALPKKVAYVTDAKEDEVVEVGGDEDVVRGILLVALFYLGPRFVCGPVSIVFIGAKAKLQMISGELF